MPRTPKLSKFRAGADARIYWNVTRYMGPVPARFVHAAPLLLALAACTGDPPPSPVSDLPPRLPVPTLAPPGPALPIKRVTLAWTGEVRGEIEVCGCPTVPYGGFERRDRYLDRLREQGEPLVVLDAGDMLVKGAKLARATDAALRGKTVLTLAVQVGLDAWAPSTTDLELRDTSEGWSRALSVNADGLDGWRVVERDGLRIGVIGVSSGAAGRAPDPAEIAERVGAAVRAATVDGWVVLSSAGTDVNKAAATVPGVGLVLATRGADLDTPVRTAGAPIIEAPDRGRFVSVVRWVIGTAPGPAGLVTDGASARGWDAWDDALERLPLQPPAALAAEKDRVARYWAAVEPEAAGRNLVLVRDRPLGTDLDLESAHDDVKSTLLAFQRASVGVAKTRAEAPSAVRYVSASRCQGCHNTYFTAWAFTDHAKAWQSLVTRQASQDPECVGCHSTAWGEPGGNASLAQPAMNTWHAVQCESCHGPGSAHADDPHGHKTTPIEPSTCLACHDPANSPQFDYGAYMKRWSCVLQKREADSRAGQR